MIFFTKNKEYKKFRGGYTLVELVVAVGLFVTVALISSSAFLGVVSSNKRTLAIRTAADNLNFAIESMSRNLETGLVYHCGTTGIIDKAQDCPNNITGDSFISFEGQKGNLNDPTDQRVYRLGDPSFLGCPSPKQICFSADGGTTFYALTDPALSIDILAFRVYGAPKDDSPSPVKQPRIVIIIAGSSGIGVGNSKFDIETTVSQRLPDFP